MEYNMKFEPKTFERGIAKTPCPYCEHPPDPFRDSQCVLNKPLHMVIPPQGAHLSCPVHPDGHHIFGSQVML